MRNQRLPDIGYMKFPFRITSKGAATSHRAAHVREQIEQILFTSPGERIFRPEFGAGVRRQIFEPNNSALATLLLRRLQSALDPALQGEVDPQSLDVKVEANTADPARLDVHISYTLAAIGHQDSFTASFGGS